MSLQVATEMAARIKLLKNDGVIEPSIMPKFSDAGKPCFSLATHVVGEKYEGDNVRVASTVTFNTARGAVEITECVVHLKHVGMPWTSANNWRIDRVSFAQLWKFGPTLEVRELEFGLDELQRNGFSTMMANLGANKGR